MTTHLSPAVIARYADRDAALDEVTVWSIEVHLEDCPDCRALVAGATTDDTRALLARISAVVDAGIATGPAPAPRRSRAAIPNRWMVWHLLPWLTMTVAVLSCAVLLQALEPTMPSLVALLAPVAPLPGVAIAWSRRADPAWELIAGTPAAGLAMLLRRTAAVLAVVVPALALASTRTGFSLALTLLPCLAFTAGTIAAGSFVGVRLAALVLGGGWALAVAVPALLTAELPVILQPGSSLPWALLTLLLAAVAALQSDSFRRLSSHN
ncbi:zf-HC2 domain-containing protein [Actinoplanes sp. NEAU-A12]|uniref:Zf-HC2 domain-containing protein n=1 Tax=Actinoplanes sandaracinus TaxID=3045177 RepID=A0ABT6WGZ0_9ACTN|nr:zf-HC2 domain-containing protein [Actinoplanes sandaracinus]MDI6098991.1 zf-HC2 domain-containing protein [Actinoplanes sandaracinus]